MKLVEGDEVEMVKIIQLRNLQSRRKLCLVLDLDHTLLHTKRLSSREGPSSWKGDDIYRWKSMGVVFLTKLRPFVRQFLDKASEIFELYVYTMGTRDYALHIVHEFLDPQGVYFSKRIISREDCTIPGQKGLDVVPIDPSAVLILDDTKRVWNGNFDNLIVIDKYYYFSGGDEREGEEKLRCASEVLTKLYFLWYDRFMDSDVRSRSCTFIWRISLREGSKKLRIWIGKHIEG